MSVNSAGVVSWANPVAGTYNVTVIAQDSKTGLSGQGVLSVAIASPKPPVVTGATITGHAGVALSFTVSAVGPNPKTYRITGAPSGMIISSAGSVSWNAPMAGTYTVTIAATDTRTGLSGQGV
jgi:hypothetical protein